MKMKEQMKMKDRIKKFTMRLQGFLEQQPEVVNTWCSRGTVWWVTEQDGAYRVYHVYVFDYSSASVRLSRTHVEGLTKSKWPFPVARRSLELSLALDELETERDEIFNLLYQLSIATKPVHSKLFARAIGNDTYAWTAAGKAGEAALRVSTRPVV